MNKEDKVADLEYCKRLVELGLILDTERYWLEGCMGGFSDSADKEFYVNASWRKDRHCGGQYPAPDSEELGEALQKVFNGREIWYSGNYDVLKRIDGYYVCQCHISPQGYRTKLDKKESNARIKMLIYLLENNLISI